MMPTEPASRRAFCTGIAVGLAFRGFAYGLLMVVPSSHDLRGLPGFLVDFLHLSYWAMAFSSPLWIPFAGGFLSAYFWRHLQVHEYVRAIWLTSAALLILFIVLTWASFLSPFACIGFFLFCLDTGMCASGVDQGSLFWNGRLGRQFMGDFSTRDEDDL